MLHCEKKIEGVIFLFNFQDSFEKNIMWRMSTLEYIKIYHKDNKISMYYYKNQQIDQGSKKTLETD